MSSALMSPVPVWIAWVAVATGLLLWRGVLPELPSGPAHRTVRNVSQNFSPLRLKCTGEAA